MTKPKSSNQVRDLPPCCMDLFNVDPGAAATHVDVALKFLWEDAERSIHDKVAGDFDYEELIATLIAARARIAELESDGDCVHAEFYEYRDPSHIGYCSRQNPVPPAA